MHLETTPPKVVIENEADKQRIHNAVAVTNFDALKALKETTSGNEFPYELNADLSSLALNGLATLQRIEDTIGYRRKRLILNPRVLLRRARERRYARNNPNPPTKI